MDFWRMMLELADGPDSRPNWVKYIQDGRPVPCDYVTCCYTLHPTDNGMVAVRNDIYEAMFAPKGMSQGSAWSDLMNVDQFAGQFFPGPSPTPTAPSPTGFLPSYTTAPTIDLDTRAWYEKWQWMLPIGLLGGFAAGALIFRS